MSERASLHLRTERLEFGSEVAILAHEYFVPACTSCFFLAVEVPLPQQHVPIHYVPKRFGASRTCLCLI